MKQILIERMLYIILALVFVGATFLGIVTLRAVEEFGRQQEVLQEQVKGQKEVLKGMQELIANQGKTTGDINNSLSCIMMFFSKPDRATFYISDLATCTLTNTKTGEDEVLPLQPNINQMPADDERRNDEVGLQASPTVRQPPEQSPTQPIKEPSSVPDALDILLDIPTNVLRRIL